MYSTNKYKFRRSMLCFVLVNDMCLSNNKQNNNLNENNLLIDSFCIIKPKGLKISYDHICHIYGVHMF